MIDVGDHHVKHPAASAVLDNHICYVELGTYSQLLFHFPSSGRLNGFSFPDRTAGNAPGTGIINGFSPLLQ